MAKNLTRKGLALGAAFTLIGSALVASPAQAAGEVTLEVNSGIGNSTIIGETFTVRAGLAPSVPVGNIAQLKYQVTNPGKDTLTFTTPTNGSKVVSDVNSDKSVYVVTPGSTSTTVANTLAIATAATATSAVTVVAWIDSDLDGVIDTAEYKSSALSVNFVKATEVAWSVDFTTPIVGDTKLKAVVSAGDINLAQLGTDPVSVRFSETTTATSNTPDTTELISASVVSGTNTMKAENTFSFDFDGAGGNAAVTTVQASKRYTAQAVYKQGGTETASDVVGTAVAKLSAAATLDTIAAPATTASTDFKVSAGAVAVRSTVLTVPVSIAATLSSKAAAGVEVTVKVAETGNTSVKTDGVISAGGKTFKSTAGATENLEFQAVTNADGKVVFNLTATGIEAGNAVEIFAYAQGVNTAGANKTTYTWTKAVVDKLSILNILGTSAEPVAAKDAAYSLEYAALDQFGALLTGSHRVKATDSTNTRYANITNGRATVSMPGVAADVTVVANVQIQDPTTSNWADVAVANSNATATGDDTLSQGVQVGSFNAIANLTLTAGATTGVALNLNAYKAANTALGDTAPTVAGGTALSGYATDSTSAVTHGSVTLSGAGLQFRSGSVTSLDSITVLTNPATGQFSGVNVYSNKAGKQTVTVTSGSVSKTVDITFSAAANDTGVTLVVDAPAYATPGSTMVVKGKLTDAYGNPVAATNGNASAGAQNGNVKFSVSYTGPGFVVSTLPTATNASGEFEFRVLLGTADSGSASVTVTYDGDDTASDDTTTPQITVTKTVTVGAAPAAAKVNVGSFNGKLVVYANGYNGKKISWKVGGKWGTAVATSDTARFARVTPVKGVTVSVDIYVDGVKTLTKSVVTK